VAGPSPAAGRGAVVLAFAPDALPSAANLRVVEARAGAEVPAAVRVLSSWPDGSVQLAEVAFAIPAGTAPRYFWAEAGPGTTRAAAPPPAAAGDPPPAEVPLAEGEVPLEMPDTEVGTMLIRVEPHPDLWYWSYLVPIGAVLGLLGWRKARLGRAEGPR